MRKEKYREERGRPFAKSKTRQEGQKELWQRPIGKRKKRYQMSREDIDANQSQRVR